MCRAYVCALYFMAVPLVAFSPDFSPTVVIDKLKTPLALFQMNFDGLGTADKLSHYFI